MTYDYRRRRDERVYEADVTSVRAVLGTPEQRCWVEREQVAQERSSANVPGAIAGAIIGGILGHQIGSGRGNDVATVGGVVAGGVVGANVGRDGGTQTYAPDVKRCEDVPGSAQPAYWDVTYNFRGREASRPDDFRAWLRRSPSTSRANPARSGRNASAGEAGGPYGPFCFWRLPNSSAYWRVNSAPRKKICAE